MRILSTMGLAGVLQSFGPVFEAEHGVALDIDLQPTAKLLDRIRTGERGDLAILTAEACDELEASGVIEARTDLARSFVGIAVQAGAPHPDIGSATAFISTLLRARSVAVSQAGASGLFMAGLLARLGIEEAMREKLTVLPSGYTAALAASGAVQIAIQQVSELLVVPGVEIVGRLPGELGGETMFSAASFRDARHHAEARALIAALSAPDQDALYRRCGLERAGMGGTKRA